jgi:translation initiation factor IF-3
MSRINIFANEAIEAKEFLLLDEQGTVFGQISKKQALEIAAQKNLDLVQINSSPPVVKLLKLDKYAYQMEKMQKEKKRKQSITKLKTIPLKLRIAYHDREKKKDQAKEFFKKGHRVIFSMKLKNREKVHIAVALSLMAHFRDELAEVSTIVKDINKIGVDSGVSMILGPKTMSKGTSESGSISEEKTND